MCREIRDELRPMVDAQVAADDDRMADLRTFRDRLTAALTHLEDLPARDGPCDPACAFLHDLPDGVLAPVLHRRTSTPEHPPVPAGDTGADGPVIACSLDGDGHADRIAQWRDLLGDAAREPLPDGGVTVRLPADRAGQVAELVVAEQRCCPFFAFELIFSGPQIALTARAPEGAEPLVATLWGTLPVGLEAGRGRC